MNPTSGESISNFSLPIIEEGVLLELEHAIDEILGGFGFDVGEIFMHAVEDVGLNESIQVFKPLDMCKNRVWSAKTFEEKFRQGEIGVIRVSPEADINAPEAVIKQIEEYGLECFADGKVKKIQPHEINSITAWSDDQLARINSAVSSALDAIRESMEQSAAKAKEGEGSLARRSIAPVPAEKKQYLVSKNQFPDLTEVRKETKKLQEKENERLNEERVEVAERQRNKKVKDLDAKAEEKRDGIKRLEQRKWTIKSESLPPKKP